VKRTAARETKKRATYFGKFVQDLAQKFFSFVSVKTSHKASFGPFTIYNFAAKLCRQNFKQKDSQMCSEGMD